MIFGFPESGHKQFKRNFLKVVVFQIQFDKVSDFPNKKNSIINALKIFYPRIGTQQAGFEITFSAAQTPIVQAVKDNENLEMKSLSGQKTVNFSNSSISLSITGKEYQTYEILKSEIEKLIEFLRICGITILNRVAIRKINVVDFKSPTNNPYPIIATLINTNLLGNLEYYPASENLKQNLQSLIYKKDAFTFNIKYGYNVPSVPSLGQLILDFDLFKAGKTEVNAMYPLLDEINQEIFDAFNWIITDNLLNLLDG